MMWDIARAASNIVLALIFQYLLIERRYPFRRTIAVIVAGSLVIFAGNALIIGTYGYAVFLRFYPLTINLPYLGLYMVIAKHRGFKMLFNFCSATSVCLAVTVLGAALTLPFGNAKWLMLFVRLLLSAAVVFLTWRYFRRLYLPLLETLDHGWGPFCLMPVAFYAYGYLTFMSAPESEWRGQIVPALLVSLIMVAGYVVILLFFHELLQSTQRDNERQILQSQVRAFQNQAELLKSSEKKLGTLRHDMRHYFSNIAALLQNGETKEALHFLGKFDEVAAGTKLAHYCENVTLNIILSFYIEKAERAGIRVETDLDIPETLPVDTIALSTVFANAIENAITACGKIPEGRARRLALTCFSSPHFILEVANTCEGTVSFGPDGLPVADRPGHGLGTRSIAAFARENGAICDCQAGDGLFRLRILIQ